MTDDVFTAFGRGLVTFAHARLVALVDDAFGDAGTLIQSLGDGKTGTTKAAFDALKADVLALRDDGVAIKAQLDQLIAAAQTFRAAMAAELTRNPFGPDEALRALTALAQFLTAYDAAIQSIAEALSTRVPDGRDAQRIKADIIGVNAPIKRAMGDAGTAISSGFDQVCALLLDQDDASARLRETLEWDPANHRLSATLTNGGLSGLAPLQFDGATVTAFFDYHTDIVAGLIIRTRLKAGLRGDKLMDKILPGQAPTADSEALTIVLDSVDGLTFGDGKETRLILPVRLALPGIELREAVIERSGDGAPLGVTFTIAGKLGDVFAVVVEGAGVTIAWVDGAPPRIAPAIPTGAGLRLKTPLIGGGGYLSYDDDRKEYGGVLQLDLLGMGITAFGLLGTDPFNLVIVIGVRFPAKIELGFGFTLAAVGGVLAIERSLDTDVLRAGLKDGIVGQLLFPTDPVAAAPQILEQLGLIFPPRQGGFVIGPIAELGWGSQAGFVKARVGIMLSLPDPAVVVLGAVQIGVPSAEIDERLRVIDLRADIIGVFTADHVLIEVALSKSKIFKMDVTGDLCLFVQWADEGMFAISAGGFFPGFEAPPKIGPMRRMGVAFAPPAPFLTVALEAYVAITSNTVQFGGKVSITAKFSKAVAQGFISVDALFQWSPHFYFVVQINAGLTVSAFGKTLAGVRFTGELSGDKPWRLVGTGAVTILFWDIPVDIGPVTWGEPRPAPAADLDPLPIAAAALGQPEAWAPLLPPDAQSLLRLAPADDTELHHPLGQIQARQMSIPLEMPIDRIGSARATRRQVHLADARLGGRPAAAIWPLTDRFAPGHFLNLTTPQVLARPEFEERASGLGMGAARGAALGGGVHCGLRWQTVCPHERTAPDLAVWTLDAVAARLLAGAPKTRHAPVNPYRTGPTPRQPDLVLAPRGMVGVIDSATMGVVAALQPASDAARMVQAGRADGIRMSTIMAGFMT